MKIFKISNGTQVELATLEKVKEICKKWGDPIEEEVRTNTGLVGCLLKGKMDGFVMKPPITNIYKGLIVIQSMDGAEYRVIFDYQKDILDKVKGGKR